MQILTILAVYQDTVTSLFCICWVAIRAAPLMCAKFGKSWQHGYVQYKLVVSSPVPHIIYLT